MKLLKQEIDNRKPNSANVKNLMSCTFIHRREWIVNYEIAVSKVLEEYSCLYKLSHVGIATDCKFFNVARY